MPTLLILSLLFVAGGSAWLWREHERAELGPGTAVLKAAQRALALGVKETGTNTGPVVDAYLRAVGIEPPANWCAAAVSAWIREAYKELGYDSPFKGTAQAKGFISQFERIAKWVPKDQLHKFAGAIPPGSIVIWSRGDPASWTGHIGVFEKQIGNELHTIEGNSGPKGDRVSRMQRKMDDPRLLGIGFL
jgi:hypothetical protein